MMAGIYLMAYALGHRPSPRWAALLAGAGFTAHAAWDFYHHQVNKVVHRSYAKFCFVIDVVTGPALAVAALAQE